MAAGDVSSKQVEELIRRRFPNWSEERIQARVQEEIARAGGKEDPVTRATAGNSHLSARRRSDDDAKMDRIEWAVDCLKSRMDAAERDRA